MDENWTQSEIFLHNILQLLAHQTDVLEDIRTELVTMRLATETEALEDAEPDPFQTLNGPSHVRADA